MQFFWILSDGTVKEISKQDYFKLKDKKHFVGWVDPSPKNKREPEVCLVKNENIILLRIEQIKEILKLIEYKKEA
jgi:hypothetical protein